MEMTSSRPYLIQAMYQWILDNNCVPHILVDADYAGVEVPPQHVQDGQIVLNVAPTAVVDLLIDKEAISFNARFDGVETDIYVPINSVAGIITRETGQGMMFDYVESEEPPPEPPQRDDETGGKPTLKLVK